MDTSKNMARVERRHHAARLKAARHLYWGRRADRGTAPLTTTQLGILASTPAVCSCWMCGNPRKWLNEKSFQERKLDPRLNRARIATSE